jgi:hypothetical protein
MYTTVHDLAPLALVGMVLDEFPRRLARSRRFTPGVPRAMTISADGERVLFPQNKRRRRAPAYS